MGVTGIKPRSERAQESLGELSRPVRAGFFERHGWWGRLLGGAVILALVGGLVGAAIVFQRTPVMESGMTGNQPILMVVLVLTNILFIGYVAYQQHLVMAARRRRHHRRLLGILTVSRTMGAENDPAEMLNAITEICRKTYDCDQVSLMKLDHETGALAVCSASGHANLAKVLGSRTRVGEGISGWVAEHRQPLILGPQFDRARFPGFQSKDHKLASAMVVPVMLRDELFGVLSVSSRSRRIRYDEEDLETLLVFAETAGIASRHAEQATWMRQTIQRLDAALSERQGPGPRAAA